MNGNCFFDLCHLSLQKISQDSGQNLYIYNGILFSNEKGGHLPFMTTWLDPEGIMLTEVELNKER